MIALFCVLIVVGLGHCDDLPSNFEVESSINRTIDEVEKLIHQDSSLPRLTRRDIVNILYNITSKDIDKYENQETINKARNIYQRALMVVLPYNAENARENIKDLYTKPPIVQIIADPSSGTGDIEVWKDEKLRSNTSPQGAQRDKQFLENLTYITEKSTASENPQTKTRYKNHRETYSEVHTKVPLKETLKLDSAPVKFTFNLENLQNQQTVTENPMITRQPVFQKPPSSAKNEEVHIVYSTSATTARTVGTSTKDARFDSKESITTAQPDKYKQNVLSFDQWRYNAPPIAIQTTTSSTKAPDVPFRKVSDELPFLPTIKTSLEDAMITSNIADAIPTFSKATHEKMKVIKAERPASIYVTPTSPSSPSSSEKSKYSSTYNLNSGGFRRITTTMTTMTVRPEVMDLLASIGLRPENITNVEDVFRKNEESLGSKSQLFNPNSFIDTTAGLTAFNAPDSPSIGAQNTFETPVSELGKGMNNLTPDVQLLFHRFGLKTSDSFVVTTSTPKPTVNTNSYTNFKPLPTSRVKDEDMKAFLARFGLGVSDSRQQKAIAVSTERPSLIEAVPNNMRQILENIGLISRRVSKTTSKALNLEPTEATRIHVFKPHEVQVKDEDQKRKINELLDTIKLVQDGKATPTDVRKVADDLLATTKKLKDGPDPLSLEEIIRIYNEDVKNEVKRQQNQKELAVEITTNGDKNLANVSTTTTTTATTTTTTTTTPVTTEFIDVSPTTSTTSTTTSDSARDASDNLNALTPSLESSTSAVANLIDLEESFGGSTRAPDPALPTKRRNGLYFLVDWNSFLEVGEEGSEKVNLRFQPKVGDRSRFLPVNVP